MRSLVLVASSMLVASSPCLAAAQRVGACATEDRWAFGQRLGIQLGEEVAWKPVRDVSACEAWTRSHAPSAPAYVVIVDSAQSLITAIDAARGQRASRALGSSPVNDRALALLAAELLEVVGYQDRSAPPPSRSRRRLSAITYAGGSLLVVTRNDRVAWQPSLGGELRMAGRRARNPWLGVGLAAWLPIARTIRVEQAELTDRRADLGVSLSTGMSGTLGSLSVGVSGGVGWVRIDGYDDEGHVGRARRTSGWIGGSLRAELRVAGPFGVYTAFEVGRRLHRARYLVGDSVAFIERPLHLRSTLGVSLEFGREP